MLNELEVKIMKLSEEINWLNNELEEGRSQLSYRQYFVNDRVLSKKEKERDDLKVELSKNIETIIDDLGESTELKRDELIIIRGILERYLGRMEDY